MDGARGNQRQGGRSDSVALSAGALPAGAAAEASRSPDEGAGETDAARSRITIDLGALRRNIRRLVELAAPAELWAVVKADAYGHGALDVAPAALEAGAKALCVATVEEGASLRAALPHARIVVLGAPLSERELEQAREARLEVTASAVPVPEGLPVHLKVDTGMGRWGIPADDLADVDPGPIVGVMSHLATADEDEDYARRQIERFAALARRFPRATRHLANSAGALRFPEARFDAVRCGIALYGLSPFGDDPATHGLEPVLSWRSSIAHVRTLRPGESTGYGREFVAVDATRIGIVPVGYGDGFRRALTGTEVLVGGRRRRVVGRVSMDCFAVELGTDDDVGTPVTIIGDGVTVEEHARRAGTINYEIVCGIRADPRRALRLVVDG